MRQTGRQWEQSEASLEYTELALVREDPREIAAWSLLGVVRGVACLLPMSGRKGFFPSMDFKGLLPGALSIFTRFLGTCSIVAQEF